MSVSKDMLDYLYTERKKYKKTMWLNKTRVNYRMRFIKKLFSMKIENKDYGL